ncbi:MAG: fibronectin type III domain-containing protein [Actinobacteria bacterium]|nr:fibronectin type III domain-containing protein [Actinomycetota bacterium]
MPTTASTSGPRRLVGLIAVLAVALAVLAAPAAAAAAPAAPTGLTLVSASKNALAVAWTPVPDAISYQVEYSTAKSMKSAKSKTSTQPYVEITKLKAKKTYYVRVTAKTARGQTPASSKLKVKTKKKSTAATYLAPTGLKAGEPASESVKLSWKSRASGLRY